MKTSTSELSQLSPKRFPSDAFPWYGSVGLLFALFLAQLIPPAIVVAVMIAFRLATVHDVSVISWPLVVAQVTAYLCSLALLFGVLPMLAQRSLVQLGLRRPRPIDLAWGVGGAIAMLLAATACAVLQETLVHVKADEVQVHLLRQARGPLLAAFALIACVGAPLFEELAFRGFLFNAVLRYVPVGWAVLLSAAMFGAAHWAPGNAGAILPLVAGGAVLAIVYYRSGSLFASMLTHSLFNLFTVVAVVLGHAS